MKLQPACFHVTKTLTDKLLFGIKDQLLVQWPRCGNYDWSSVLLTSCHLLIAPNGRTIAKEAVVACLRSASTISR